MSYCSPRTHLDRFTGAFAVAALGLLLSGCSLEKRTLMSGFHVEQLSKPKRVEHSAQQAREVFMLERESAADVFAVSNALNPTLSNPEPQAFMNRSRRPAPTSTWVEQPTPFVEIHVDLIAPTDTTASTELAIENNKLRHRAIGRGLLSLVFSVMALTWAADASMVLIALIGIFLAVGAVKWFILAGKPEQLRLRREEQIRARQDRSLKAILIRILKWLLGIPIAFVLFLGMWFTIFGGI